MNTLRTYFEMLIRRWWVLLAAVAVCTTIAALLSAAATPMYTSETEVLINQQSAADVFDPNASGILGSAALTREASNEAQFARGDAVRNAVEDSLGFEAAIEASTSNRTDVLTLTAIADDPSDAQSIAQTYAEKYLVERRERYIADFVVASANVQAQIDQLNMQLLDDPELSEPEEVRLTNLRDELVRSRDELNIAADLAARGSGQIITVANLPTTPFSPATRRNVIVGFVLGVMFGTAMAVLLDRLNQSLQSPADLEAITAMSNLVLVPIPPGRNKNVDETRLVSIVEPDSLAAEAYRTLRAAIQFIAIDSQLRVVQVTSANRGEGTTTVAANLAIAMAMAGQTVALVDSDLRSPTVHSRFGVAQEPGFSNVLHRELRPQQVAVKIKKARGDLTVIPGGAVPPLPSELLSRPEAVAAFESLKELADVIVIDSPPVVGFADALVISGLCDATLLVASGRTTRRADIYRALELLEQVEAPVIGTVLNGVKRRRLSYSYGYDYRSRYGASLRRKTPLERLVVPEQQTPPHAEGQPAVTQPDQTQEVAHPTAADEAPPQASPKSAPRGQRRTAATTDESNDEAAASQVAAVSAPTPATQTDESTSGTASPERPWADPVVIKPGGHRSTQSSQTQPLRKSPPERVLVAHEPSKPERPWADPVSLDDERKR